MFCVNSDIRYSNKTYTKKLSINYMYYKILKLRINDIFVSYCALE